MLTLALDTTTRAGSVAVVRDATVLAVVHGDAARTHGERLPAEIARALQDAGVAAGQLQLLAVASGPGAFTGLRIGLAAVQGLTMVLNLPVVAVSALDALALAAVTGAPLMGTVPLSGGQSPSGSPSRDGRSQSRPPSAIATWMDAARGEVFAAFYEFAHHPEATPPTSVPIPTSVPVVAAPEVVLASLPAHSETVFVGDGATKYSAQILQHGGARHRVIAAPATLAQFVAYIGEAAAARGEAGPPHALQPLYVRRPDAELERARRQVP